MNFVGGEKYKTKVVGNGSSYYNKIFFNLMKVEKLSSYAPKNLDFDQFYK